MVNSVIVVLGAATTKTAQATPCLIRRTHSGCEVLREKNATHLLLCGGQTNSHHFVPEAEVMAALARDKGIDEDRIVMEGQSRNTLENAIFTKRLIAEYGWDDVTVVTDRYHILRARMVFGALGVRATFKVAQCPPHAGSAQIISAFYEVPALLWYGIRLLSGHHKPYLKKSV